MLAMLRAAQPAALTFLVLSLLSTTARAQTAGAAPPAAPAPVATATPVASEPTPADPIDLSGAPGKGFTASFGDAFSLNLRSRIQVRYQLDIPSDTPDEQPTQQLVNIGTLRVWLSGHALTPELGYMIQLALASRDYRDGAISPVYDAYLDWRAHRDASVRVGQQFVQFDRLRTIREWALQMADRPRPVAELTLDRDVGVTLYSDHFLGDSSPLAYRVGVFGGGGINLASGKTPGALVVGRLELRPLGDMDDDVEGDLDRRPDPRLAIGGGLAVNANSNRARSTTGATYQGGTTDYVHAATDLVFKWQGVALQAEYLWKDASDEAIESIDEAGEPRSEATRSGHGWVLQASYVLPFPLEVIGRLSRVIARRGTDPRLVTESIELGQEIGGGLTYYVNGHRFKLQADWIARTTHDFAMDRADHVMHVQLDATF
jgi:hypothetical protein